MNNSITIAIAEDYIDARKGIAAFIEAGSPHKVVVMAEHGADLIEQINQLGYIPDVCLLDISMPVMNGFDTLIAAGKLFPCMKCIALTMIKMEYSIICMIKYGARAYVLKNSSPKLLIEAIQVVHTAGYYYTNIATGIVSNLSKAVSFTERELQFLNLCCDSELTLLDIATQMCVSYRTAQDCQKTLCEKTSVNNRIGLALFAVSTGLVFSDHILPINASPMIFY